MVWFEEWISVSYRKVIFWAFLLMFLTAAAAALYYRDAIQASLEKQIAEQHAPISKRPARFTEMHGTVKVKKVGSLNWISAEQVEELHPGDYIQTLKDSSAKIIFFDGSTSTLSPDSLTSIVESHESQQQVRSVAVEVSSGAIDLATGKKNKPEDEAKVMTPKVEARLREYSEVEARYNREKGESRFYVFGGSAQAGTRGEEKPTLFELQARQGITISGRGQEKIQAERYILPLAPKLLNPANASVFQTSEASKIELKWQPVQDIDMFQVNVAPAATPHKSVVSKRVRGVTLRLPPLDPAIYAWQVQSVSTEGTVSRSNELFKFAVNAPVQIRRGASIQLKVDNVIKLGDIYEVIGRTDPGVYLEINGEFVQVNGDGSFKHFTGRLPAGTTKLRLRAKDLSGLTKSIDHPLPT